jgi:hypothetical protein
MLPSNWNNDKIVYTYEFNPAVNANGTANPSEKPKIASEIYCEALAPPLPSRLKVL